MLAYLLWHRHAEGVQREAYEHAAERFHRSLAHSPPAGFLGSAVYRVAEPSWLAPVATKQPGGNADSDADAGVNVDAPSAVAISEDPVVYEDWYLVQDFTALGVLNEAAVAHGHRTAHDEVAHRFGAGAGGLYGLLEGHAALGGPALADVQSVIWIARPPGAQRRALGELLGDGMDPAHSSLWRRALVLGPAPEYCLLAPELPAGVAPTRLPAGWRATIAAREVVWRG
jgi:hypothetical protein